MALTRKLNQLTLIDGYMPDVASHRAVERRGAADARKGIYASEIKSAAEAEITSFYQHACKDAFGNANAEVSAQLETARAENPVSVVPEAEEVRADFDAHADSIVTDARWRLADEVRNTLATFSAWMQFRVENEIDREALYPKSRINHFGTIFLVMIADAFLNAAFYGAAAQGGLIHGLIMALIVSITLVGTGSIAGAFAVRSLYASERHRRLLGQVGTILYIVISLLMSIAAASYRDALAHDFELASMATIGSIIRAPYDLTFDATCLLLFSLGASWLACWKGLHLDDVVPGYGDVDRAYKKAKVSFDTLWEATNERVIVLVNNGHAHLDHIVSHGDAEVMRQEKSIARAESAISTYIFASQQIESAWHFTIAGYREANGAVSQRLPMLHEDSFQAPSLVRPDIEQLQIRLGDSKSSVDALRTAAAKAKAAISAVGQAAQRDLEVCRKKLEQAAPAGVPTDSPNLLGGTNNA